VHLRVFGKARPGGETPAPHTPFFIGSVTKSFTALAVMQLVEAGKIELDARSNATCPGSACRPTGIYSDDGAPPAQSYQRIADVAGAADPG